MNDWWCLVVASEVVSSYVERQRRAYSPVGGSGSSVEPFIMSCNKCDRTLFVLLVRSLTPLSRCVRAT